MANLTLSIDDRLLRSARLAAQERETTLTGLVRDFLSQFADEQAHKNAVLAGELEHCFKKNTVRIGNRTWTREDLHERR
ncbi:MAG: DUF6364 family protein [Kiritimatiellae bacterium]|nr:DUF6364 family protein [Kiritimatiellia bacterium]MDD3544595.1 DUF6364 family protein [Kiritimatiellia bacterium]MDD4025337.1 DUF6364 family protein [Kiritimatiellia bacterium]MDD4622502.1 DUF6364 family protein [Kiritimatiellia bacterium]